MRPILSTVAALALVAGALPAAAQQPFVDVSADVSARATYTIKHPGVYEVHNERFAGANPRFVIASDDVTLDFAGHTILGPGGKQGVAVLVQGVSNVRIVNGHLQSFGIGVQAVGSRNVTIEGMQIDGQDLGGAPPDVEIGVMLVDSRGCRVVGNTITNTFLGVFVRGEDSGGNLVADNVITGGDNGELAICYNPAPDAEGGGPDGDLVTHNLASHFRRGLSLSADSTGNVVRDNTIAYFDMGIIEATAGSNTISDNDLVEISP